MDELFSGFTQALGLILSFDADLYEIVFLSLQVSLSAVGFATLIGLPLGAGLAVSSFRGRSVFVVGLNTFMGLPPVVVGLIVYLLLSRAGPFGIMGLLFTPTAMIIAQTILITPIIAALTRQIISELWGLYREQLLSFGASPRQRSLTLLWDGRVQLLTIVLAGFGRAIAEVGAVMIVGGNIEHATRVLTTAIALETSRGDLAMALGLGAILIFISLSVNIAISAVSLTKSG